MNIKRYENGIEVIKYAIKNNLSVNKASKSFGYSRSYLKNIKSDIDDEYKEGTIQKDMYENFYSLYNQYITSHKPENVSAEVVLSNENNLKLVPNTDALVFSKKGNTFEITNKTNQRIKTLEQLLEAAKVDSNLWDVRDYIINKWDVTAFKNGEPTVENFQVKARLEKKVEVQKAVDIANLFKEMIAGFKPAVNNFNFQDKLNFKENNMLEIDIFDLHLGKLCWAGETGENYDTKIARERFIYSINMLLKRAEGFEYSRILFPIGSDFFNSDTILNTTTNGTFQDEDLRWQKTFTLGTQLIVEGVEILKQKGVPVDVLIIPGNHDFTRSFYLGTFLEGWYRNDSQVNVNNGASPRKYYNFGKVLLGFTHGNEEKPESLPLLMATEKESKALWSNTVYHEWHLGHIHRKKTVKYTILDKNQVTGEDLGVTLRYMSSLTGTEEWHHRKGYVGQVRAANGFVWNSESGLIAELTSNYVIQ